MVEFSMNYFSVYRFRTMGTNCILAQLKCLLDLSSKCPVCNQIDVHILVIHFTSSSLHVKQTAQTNIKQAVNDPLRFIPFDTSSDIIHKNNTNPL